jgi:hypothetical protein
VITEGSAEVRSGEWQELTVEVATSHFRGLLNGIAVVEGTDDAYSVGRVGVDQGGFRDLF